MDSMFSAARFFSNKSLTTSKCGKNEKNKNKKRHQAQCVTYVLTTF